MANNRGNFSSGHGNKILPPINNNSNLTIINMEEDVIVGEAIGMVMIIIALIVRFVVNRGTLLLTCYYRFDE